VEVYWEINEVYTILAIIAFPLMVIGVAVVLILMVTGSFVDAVGWFSAIIHLVIFGWAARSTGKHLWQRLVIGSEGKIQK
jgi:hypothetical protein